jgi:hypothetical protein
MSIVGIHLSDSFNLVSKRLRMAIAAEETSSIRTSFSAGVQTQSLTVAKLTKVIALAFGVITGIVALQLLILWIASGRFLERFPF